MNDGELIGLVRGEEGREDAILGAPPPEELAGGTGGASTHASIQREGKRELERDKERERKGLSCRLEVRRRELSIFIVSLEDG